MKIKVALLERDQNYLNRIVTAFNTKYADKFEIYSFTDQRLAIEVLEKSRIDVFVASDADVFQINTDDIPDRCGFAYFVESPDIETVGGHRVICKFQKIDLIYKQILSIYSENAGSVSGLKIGEESTKMIIFSTPCGGVGSSCMAAACAVHFASKNKRTLYLNVEKFGSSDLLFNGEGQFDMSDVIYALKSKKANLTMKLESCVKQDRTGVYFYSPTKVALDMLEITTEDLIRLLSELRLTGTYDYIIVDMDFGLDKDSIKIYRQAHGIAWIGDGADLSNSKIQRAYSALSIMEREEDAPLLNRICLIYNKFSSKSSNTVTQVPLKNIGGAPVYMHAEPQQIVNEISKMDIFENIL